MADHDKTEKATPKRRQEARKKGQVPRSTDLNGAVVMGAGLIGIVALGPSVVASAAGSMRETLARIAHPDQVTSASGLSEIFHAVLNTVIRTVGPVAGLCLAAGLLVNIAQVGARPRLSAMKPDFKRLNPVNGIKGLFGKRVLFETGKALMKVAIVGAVVAIALVPQLMHLGASVGTSPGALGRLMGSGVMSIAERAVGAYVLIGVLDYVVQRRRHEKGLRMSKQEVKEEHKQHSLPPEVKAQIKRRQLQASRARMMAAIPQADVVVTNPTHYAVALRYDGSREAPEVVAKGKDLVAGQIRRIASEHDVPIVPNPPLARSLHASVEIGQMIPEELYAAVAQVLAFVYRAAARRRAAR
jgi:flagellar biosynthetic protein FlhB